MKFADLIDLEWLLADEARLADSLVEAARPAALQACAERGVQAGAARGLLDADRPLRERLCFAVLAVARQRGLALPGRRVARATATVGAVLAVLGAVLGAGAAAAVLAYDGKTPVNVLHFVGVFFALQIVLLALLVWFAARAQRAEPGDGPGLPQRAVAWVVDRVLGAPGRAAADLLRTLRTRRSLYAGVEKWTLFVLVQRFGVAFNAAALLCTLALVTVTDLTFSWSTTLGLRGSDVHRVVAWLSAPWWFWPEAAPSLAAVEASQWIRMPGAFVNGDAAAQNHLLRAEWWRFLVAGLVTYGLLPRLLALGVGSLQRWRALRSVGLDHAGCHRLFARLLQDTIGWAGPAPEHVRGEAPQAVGPGTASPHVPPQPGAAAVVLCWGSIARRAAAVGAVAAARLQVRLAATLPVGGASLEADARALRELAQLEPQRAIAVFAAGQQPTADVVSFLREVRRALGVGRPIVVLLAEATDGAVADGEPEERAIWRRSLGALGDAHLWLETLAGGP